MAEVVALLLRDAPVRIEVLRRALGRADASECEFVAHNLMGICSIAGAVSLAVLAESIQRHAAAGNLGSCQKAMAALDREVEKVRHEVANGPTRVVARG